MPRPLKPKRRKLTLHLLSVLAAVAIVSAGVTWSISPIDPVNWRSTPPADLAGPYAPNGRLAAIDRLSVPTGPEDVAVAENGDLITGVADGRLIRIPLGEAPEDWVTLGGRPLGMAWHPDGRLLVCVADQGLVAVAPDGSSEVILSRYLGEDLSFLDDVDVAEDGTVYVTEATNRFRYAQWKLDVIENRGSGRLLRMEPDGSVDVLMHDLHFANGVAVATDESFVVVVETARYRVRRILLGPTPSSNILIDGLPGFPDGVSNAGDDTFWLTLAAPRNALVDALSGYGAARRLLGALPQEMLPKAERVGHVVRFNDAGMILESLDDRRPNGFAMITNAEQVGNKLYLGSLDGGALGILHLGDEPEPDEESTATDDPSDEEPETEEPETEEPGDEEEDEDE